MTREGERKSERDREGGGGGGGGSSGTDGGGGGRKRRDKRGMRERAWTESSGSSARASVRNVVPLLVTVTSAPYHRHVVLYAVEYKCSAS